ncbi:hypothetical protein Tco_1130143 [Tanacetum coccineum]
MTLKCYIYPNIQKGYLNGKGEAKFAFQPKKKINNNVVSKEAKGMPEAMRKVKGIKVGGNNVGVKELDEVFDDDTGIAKCMEEDGMVGMDDCVLNDC